MADEFNIALGLSNFCDYAHQQWNNLAISEREEWNAKAKALEDPEELALLGKDDLERKAFVEKTLAGIYKGMRALGKEGVSRKDMYYYVTSPLTLYELVIFMTSSTRLPVAWCILGT